MPDFYARFLRGSEEVRAKFRNTDFKRQHQMLLKSLQLIADATTGSSIALRDIRERAETHSREHLDIPPHRPHHRTISLPLHRTLRSASSAERSTNQAETRKNRWVIAVGYGKVA